jgi:hypothetical protein
MKMKLIKSFSFYSHFVVLVAVLNSCNLKSLSASEVLETRRFGYDLNDLEENRTTNHNGFGKLQDQH